MVCEIYKVKGLRITFVLIFLKIQKVFGLKVRSLPYILLIIVKFLANIEIALTKERMNLAKITNVLLTSNINHSLTKL